MLPGDVFQKIKEVFDASTKYNKAGELISFKELTIPEACDILEDEYEQSAMALTKLKKIQNKIVPKTKEPEKTYEPVKTKSKTLSNSLTNEAVSRNQLSRSERTDRAFAALHNQR